MSIHHRGESKPGVSLKINCRLADKVLALWPNFHKLIKIQNGWMRWFYFEGACRLFNKLVLRVKLIYIFCSIDPLMFAVNSKTFMKWDFTEINFSLWLRLSVHNRFLESGACSTSTQAAWRWSGIRSIKTLQGLCLCNREL